MPTLTETFFKILNTKTGEWYSTKNSRATWSRLSGAKTTMTANNLDPEVYKVYEFVGVGKPVESATANE